MWQLLNFKSHSLLASYACYEWVAFDILPILKTERNRPFGISN